MKNPAPDTTPFLFSDNSLDAPGGGFLPPGPGPT